MDEMDFDSEFMTDEEVEAMIDSIVVAVGENVEEDERRTSMIDFDVMKKMLFAYKTLKYVAKGRGARVSYTLNEPYNSMGYISVVGKSISFPHPEWFLKIASCASNVEVYARTDGTVQLNLTFHGITTPLE